MFDQATLTSRQQAWFQSVREGLERETGRTIDQWAELARACPETKHRARLAWLKHTYGLGQNRASLVLDAAFGGETTSSGSPADLLWQDLQAKALFEAVRHAITALPDVVLGQRKQFTAFSRKVQFAAARPSGHALILGLAVPPEGDLVPVTRAGWSERLTSQVRVDHADRISALADPIRSAWERS